jgi:P27 family predicted phage terminase small subunit
LSERAKGVWSEVADQLAHHGLLTIGDRHALEMWSETFAAWQELRESVQTHGHSIVRRDRAGRVKSIRTNPEVALAVKVGALAARLASELGLSPSSRSRLRVEVPKIAEETEKSRMEKRVFGD